ncbi:hypothetical protein V3C99_013032 [Haemonchus contortus]|uniref:TIL domain-containing protein n=1 Tax=Haemonchus contortus TaxID=6289 RepID=A0A7I4Y1U1_HAECO
MTLLLTVVSLVVFSVSYCADETYDDNTAVITETVETHSCKTNEVWMECGTCENKCGEPRVPCPRMCQPARCQCLTHKGFRRNKNGDCVKCD